MEDSNILYYIILGAIYVISRVLKKKKPVESIPEADFSEETETYAPPKKRRSPVEDLLKEISKEMGTEVESEPIVEEVPRQEVIEHKQRPVEHSDLVDRVEPTPAKNVEREKLVFGKFEKFKVEEEKNPTLDKVHELLASEEGVKSAFVVQEIFQRKY